MNQYAVWGNPISQSKSPRIHQLFAEQTQKSVSYIAKLGDEEMFEQQLLAFFAEGAKGANITSPFKQRAFALADEYSERCLIAEACNTLKVLPDGRLYADNTDGLGLVADLGRIGWLKPSQKVLILGAGGATQGVIHPLLEAEQQIWLYNRTLEKATRLAEKLQKLGKNSPRCIAEIPNEPFDLVINATSLGLQGKYITLPDRVLQSANFYDMQYAPQMATPFLNYVRAAGAEHCQDGLGMLVGQASYSFELWEGVLPEIHSVLEQVRQ